MDINLIPHPFQGTPYGETLDLAVVLAIACWLLSVLTREYSWVDRVLPVRGRDNGPNGSIGPAWD